MMALTKQLSMLQDVPEQVLGDVRDKILELYRSEPEVAEDDKILLLAYWLHFDDLAAVLGDRIEPFARWWLFKATVSESVRRSRQSLTEHGILPEPPDVKLRRDQLQEIRRSYWGKYR